MLPVKHDGLGEGPAQIIRFQSQLASARKNFDALNEEIAIYSLPNKSDFITRRTTGEKRTLRLFDALGFWCTEMLSSALHAILTNPALTWFQLEFEQKELNEQKAAAVWLRDATRLIRDELNASNFNLRVPESYQDYVAFGTMAMLHEDRSPSGWDGWLFHSVHIGYIWAWENDEGKVDGFIREFRLRPSAVINKFGNDAMGINLRQRVSRGGTDELRFFQYVARRDMVQAPQISLRKLAHEQRPYLCRYVYVDGNEYVGEEEGYYELPLYFPRWRKTPRDEVLGRGPGEIALPFVRTLNEMTRLHLRTQAKSCDPPLVTDRSDTDIDMEPGGLTTLHRNQRLEPLPMTTPAQEQVYWNGVERTERMIRQIYYIDKLDLPPREQIGEMSATEVVKRYEKMQEHMGPVLHRITFEFLDPLVKRCFASLYRAGQIAEIPTGIMEAGGTVKVKYVGPLARAQRSEEVGKVRDFLAVIASIAEVLPETLDKIDGDEVVDYLSTTAGVPPEILRSDQDVKQLRELRAQQAAQQQQLDAAEQAAGAANQASQAGLQVVGGGQ